MKFADLTYEEALRRHPEGVSEIVRKLRSGKSKSRNAEPYELSWSYEGCVRMEGGGTLAEVFEAEARRQNTPPLEERVADEVRRTHVSLMGRIGRFYGGAELPEKPPEIEANVRANLLAQEEEQKRVDSMTPEERRREVDSLLSQLRKGRGFVGFTF